MAVYRDRTDGSVQGDVSTKAGVEGIVAAISAREERVSRSVVI